MDTKQANKLAMLRAVAAFFKADAVLFQDHAILLEKIAKLNESIATIVALSQTQAAPTQGVVTDRDKAIQDALDAAEVIAGVVLSYATDKQLGELAAKVRLRAADLTQGPHQRRVQVAQRVHDAAAEVVTALTDYKVTPATLTKFQGDIAAATELLSAPRQRVGERKATTQQLAQTFRAIDLLLEVHLDKLMLPFKRSHPDVHNKYLAARVIVDRGGGHTPPDTAPPFGGTPPTPPAAGS